MGRQNRKNPYVPIFNRTLARKTLPAVGASVWAAGNHVWKGNMGTLIAKAMAKARKTQIWKLKLKSLNMALGILKLPVAR